MVQAEEEESSLFLAHASLVLQPKEEASEGGYYISALQNSIISLGQLDEGGSRVEIDRGVLRIWDNRGRLL
jgi:hypothetical protein